MPGTKSIAITILLALVALAVANRVDAVGDIVMNR